MEDGWPTAEETKRIFRITQAIERIRPPPLNNGTLKRVIIDNLHLMPKSVQERLLNSPRSLITNEDKIIFRLYTL